MKYFITFITFLIFTTSVFSQERMLMMSQYIHNQYLLNSAFGGSRDVLTAFGSYRQQFAGSPNPPNSQSFTMHAPLKDEHVALGGIIYHETYNVFYDGLKATMSYTYRLITESENKIAFSLNAGLIAHSWGKNIGIYYIDPDDPILQGIENYQNDSRFVLGFGTAWYGKNFFLGFSVYDFFYRKPYDPDALFFTLGKSSYMFTGGYLFDVSENFRLQPSMLINIEPENKAIVDISATTILMDIIWIGGTFRTNKEFVGIVGWQITPQLRVAYSYDFPTGYLKKFSAGSHEISVQFDFRYKINTSSPKFF